MIKDIENLIHTFKLREELSFDDIVSDYESILYGQGLKAFNLIRQNLSEIMDKYNHKQKWINFFNSYPVIIDYSLNYELTKFNAIFNRLHKLLFIEYQTQSRKVVRAEYYGLTKEKDLEQELLIKIASFFGKMVEIKQESIEMLYLLSIEDVVNIDYSPYQYSSELFEKFEKEIEERVLEAPFDYEYFEDELVDYLQRANKVSNLTFFTHIQASKLFIDLTTSIQLLNVKALQIFDRYCFTKNIREVEELENISLKELSKDIGLYNFEDFIRDILSPLKESKNPTAYDYLMNLQINIIDNTLIKIFLQALIEADYFKSYSPQSDFHIENNLLVMNKSKIVAFHFPYNNLLEIPSNKLSLDFYNEGKTKILINARENAKNPFFLYYASHINRFKITNSKILSSRIKYVLVNRFQEEQDAKKYIKLLKKHFLDYLYFDNKKKSFHISRRINKKHKA